MNKTNVFWLLAMAAFAVLAAVVDADMARVDTRIATAEERRLDSSVDANRRQRQQQERRVREDTDRNRVTMRERQRAVNERHIEDNSRRTAVRLSDGSSRRMTRMADISSLERRENRDVRTAVERRELAAGDSRRFGERVDNRRVREESARRLDIVDTRARRENMSNERSRATERTEVVAERRSRQTDDTARRSRGSSPTRSVAIDDASRRRDLREKDPTRTDDRMGNLGYARAMKITDEQGNGGWSNIAISGSLAVFAVIFYMQKANGKQRRDSIKCE